MSELLTFNNDIMELIASNLDTESHLIVALTCKEMYKILKTFNENKKLNATLRYLTSTLSLLKYGHINKCPWTHMTIDKIVRSNERLECLKYAIENCCPLKRFKYPTDKNGLLVTPQECLNGDGCPWPDTCLDAAKNGYFECLQYLHEEGYPWSGYIEDTCTDAAAGNGHLECLEYLHENGCPWSSHTCSYAALYGHLECLKYCHENGCPWHESTSHRAAYNGHLECIKYCHENGCPFSPYTCIVADRNGHLECVKYCRDNWLS